MEPDNILKLYEMFAQADHLLELSNRSYNSLQEFMKEQEMALQPQPPNHYTNDPINCKANLTNTINKINPQLAALRYLKNDHILGELATNAEKSFNLNWFYHLKMVNLALISLARSIMAGMVSSQLPEFKASWENLTLIVQRILEGQQINSHFQDLIEDFEGIIKNRAIYEKYLTQRISLSHFIDTPVNEESPALQQAKENTKISIENMLKLKEPMGRPDLVSMASEIKNVINNLINQLEVVCSAIVKETNNNERRINDLTKQVDPSYKQLTFQGCGGTTISVISAIASYPFAFFYILSETRIQSNWDILAAAFKISMVVFIIAFAGLTIVPFILHKVKDNSAKSKNQTESQQLTQANQLMKENQTNIQSIINNLKAIR